MFLLIISAASEHPPDIANTTFARCHAHRCDNVGRLATAVSSAMERELRDPGRFKQLYLWSFDYGKEQPESRTICALSFPNFVLSLF